MGGLFLQCKPIVFFKICYVFEARLGFSSKCSTTGKTKALWYVLSSLWDGAYKSSLAAGPLLALSCELVRQNV